MAESPCRAPPTPAPPGRGGSCAGAPGWTLPGWTAPLLLAAALAAPSARAGQAQPLADDPALEAQVMQVAEELRCLVCQNETLAASQADLAVDLRRQIRERLARGEPPGRIVDFMVTRYGEFVRYRPALTASTALLWFGPFLLLLLVVAVFAAHWRNRRRAGALAVQPLSDAEQQRVRRLLADAQAQR